MCQVYTDFSQSLMLLSADVHCRPKPKPPADMPIRMIPAKHLSVDDSNMNLASKDLLPPHGDSSQNFRGSFNCS